jgi:hypothetical protein
MSDSDLIDAVAHVTGEDSHEIRRRGFVLTGPDDTGPEPECLLDVMLVDLPETGTVDWDALGFGCREPFFTSTLKARTSTFGAACFVGSALVVVGVNFSETRLRRPNSCIARCTVLRHARSRSFRASRTAAIFWLPSMPCDSA